MLTQLLVELTRAALTQPAVRAALDELIAAALPRFMELGIAAGPSGLDDLVTLAVQLAPRSREATLAFVGESSGIRGEDLRRLLAMSLSALALRLADLGRRKEALAVIQEAVDIYRELASARPTRSALTWPCR